MNLDRQRGELSLFWCAVFMGLLSFAAMAALFSMRYDRNLFSEAWTGFARTPELAKAIDTTKQALPGNPSAQAALRKCTINGVVTYSNVECDAKLPSSRKVEIHVSQGIEAPKTPAPDAGQPDASAAMQNKMIDKAASSF